MERSPKEIAPGHRPKILKFFTSTLGIIVLIAIIASASTVAAVVILHNNQLNANLGNITSSSPTPTASPTPTPTPTQASNIVIIGGTLHGAQYLSISTDGSSIQFPDFSMIQGTAFTVNINLKNTGQATGTVLAPTVNGLTDPTSGRDVMTMTAQNTYPITLNPDGTITLIWNCLLVGPGIAHPTISLNLT